MADEFEIKQNKDTFRAIACRGFQTARLENNQHEAGYGLLMITALHEVKVDKGRVYFVVHSFANFDSQRKGLCKETANPEHCGVCTRSADADFRDSYAQVDAWSFHWQELDCSFSLDASMFLVAHFLIVIL